MLQLFGTVVFALNVGCGSYFAMNGDPYASVFFGAAAAMAFIQWS